MDIREFFGDQEDKTPLWLVRKPKTEQEVFLLLKEEKEAILEDFDSKEFALGGTITTKLLPDLARQAECYDNVHFDILEGITHYYACTKNIRTEPNFDMPSRDGENITRKYPSSRVRAYEKNIFLELKQFILVNPAVGTFNLAIGLLDQKKVDFKIEFSSTYDSSFVERHLRYHPAFSNINGEQDQWCRYLGSNGNVSKYQSFVSLFADPQSPNFPFDSKSFVGTGHDQRCIYVRKSQTGIYTHEVSYGDSPYLYSPEEVRQYFKVKSEVGWYLKSSHELQACQVQGQNTLYYGKYPKTPLVDGYYQDASFVYDSEKPLNGHNRIMDCQAEARRQGKSFWDYKSGNMTLYFDGYKALPSHFPQLTVVGRTIMYSHDVWLDRVALSGSVSSIRGRRQRVYVTGTNVAGSMVVRDNVIGYTKQAYIRGGVLKLFRGDLGSNPSDFVYVYTNRGDYLRMLQCRDKLGEWPVYDSPTATLEGSYQSYIRTKKNSEDRIRAACRSLVTLLSYFVEPHLLSDILWNKEFTLELLGQAGDFMGGDYGRLFGSRSEQWMPVSNNDLLSGASIDWAIIREGVTYKVMPTRNVPFPNFKNLLDFLTSLRELKSMRLNEVQWHLLRFYMRESNIPVRYSSGNRGDQVDRMVYWVGYSRVMYVPSQGEGPLVLMEDIF